MKLGIPTLIEFRTIEQHVKFAAEHKIDFVEVNFSFPWFQTNKVDSNEFVELSSKYNVGYTIHLHDQLNPFEFSPEIRNAAIENLHRVFEFSRTVNAKKITMHMVAGMYSSISGKKIYACDVCRDQYLENVKAFIELCKTELAGTDTVFCIENTSGYLPFQKDAIELMLKEDCFGLTFDIGHNYKAGGNDEIFILSHIDKLQHFHIHDVSEKGNHYALGRGILDIVRYISLVKDTTDCAVLEVKESSAIEESLKYLQDHSLL